MLIEITLFDCYATGNFLKITKQDASLSQNMVVGHHSHAFYASQWDFLTDVSL